MEEYSFEFNNQMYIYSKILNNQFFYLKYLTKKCMQ